MLINKEWNQWQFSHWDLFTTGFDGHVKKNSNTIRKPIKTIYILN